MYREVVLHHDTSECFGKENKGKIGECSFCYNDLASRRLFSSIPLRPTFVAQPLRLDHQPSRLDHYSARLGAWTPTLVVMWDDQYAITQ
jgi:hypothetical protein